MKQDVLSDPQAEEAVPPGRFEPTVRGLDLKRVAKVMGTVLLLLVVGICITAWLIHTAPSAPRSSSGLLPPLVEVLPLLPQNIDEVFLGYGSARADQEATLSAEVDGLIVEIPHDIEDGSRVDKGGVLARIDDRPYRREIERAEAQIADIDAQLQRLEVERSNAEKLIAISAQEVKVNQDEYKRLTDLFERDVASKKEWDFARLAYQRALRELQTLQNDIALIEPRKAALLATHAARTTGVELARLDLERCSIRAPFDCQIVEMKVEIGDRVGAGNPVARLIGPRHIEVPIELPLGVRPRVAVGAICRLRVDSMPGVQWEAPISRLGPLADENSRTFTAYVEIDNSEQAVPLVPGYFLTARVQGPVIAGALVIPRSAIVRGKVFVANSETAQARRIEVRTFVADKAVVSGELHEGDLVILTNLDRVCDGGKVRTVETSNSQEVKKSKRRNRDV